MKAETPPTPSSPVLAHFSCGWALQASQASAAGQATHEIRDTPHPIITCACSLQLRMGTSGITGLSSGTGHA